MPGLPHSDNRAVRLNLIDVAPLDPDRRTLRSGRGNDLLLNDGLLHNDRLLHDHGLGDDRRSRLNDHRLLIVGPRQCRTDHSADQTAGETGPEMASTTTPATMTVMVMVMMISAMPPVMRPGECPEGHRRDHSRNQYLLHFFTSFPETLFAPP